MTRRGLASAARFVAALAAAPSAALAAALPRFPCRRRAVAKEMAVSAPRWAARRSSMAWCRLGERRDTLPGPTRAMLKPVWNLER